MQEPTLKKSDTTIRADETRVDAPDTLVGTVLGQYRVLRKIGAGGQSAVYEAEHQILHNKVALKILLPDRIPDATTIGRMQQEGKAVASLQHKNIVRLWEFAVTDQGQPYLVMDLAPGKSLSALMKTQKRLPPDEAIELALAICDGLIAAHAAGIVHRDLKPGNVIVDTIDGIPTAKLIDFGLAKMEGENAPSRTLTQTGEIIGTPHYMSPEQCQGYKLDARSDIYSLGCMLYEMVAGEPPIQGDNPLQIVIGHLESPVKPFSPTLKVPEGLQSIVMHCLAKDREDRYADVSQLREDLLRLQHGDTKLSVKHRRSAKRRRAQMPVHQRMQIYAGITVAGVVVALVAAFFPVLAPILVDSFAPDIQVDQAIALSNEMIKRHQLDAASAALEPAVDKQSSRADIAVKQLAFLYALANEPKKTESLYMHRTHNDLLKTAELLHFTGAPMVCAQEPKDRHPAEARPLLMRAAAIFKDKGGAEDKLYVKELLFLARCDAAQGKTDEAIANYKSVLPLLSKVWGEDSVYTQACRYELDELIKSSGNQR